MKQFLSLKELAEVFGVSERHLFRLKAAGKLPRPIRIGRCDRWTLEEFREHFAEGRNGRSARERRALS